MNIEPAMPTTKNPSAQFAGDVWLDPIALPHEADQTMVVATVRFAPGARTAWHSHEHGQYLRVTQGIGRFGTRDGSIIEVHPGETIYTPPGEEHWHAAAPGVYMEHIAMLQNGEDPAQTTSWGAHITDDEYRGTASRHRRPLRHRSAEAAECDAGEHPGGEDARENDDLEPARLER